VVRAATSSTQSRSFWFFVRGVAEPTSSLL